MPTFPTIPLSRRDVDSPIDEDLVDDLHDRDEGLREHPFHLFMNEVSDVSTSYVKKFTFFLYIAETAKKMIVPLDTKVDGTTTGTFQLRMSSGSILSDEPTDTKNAYDPTSPTDITFTDVSSVKGTVVEVELWIKNSGGTPDKTYARSIIGAVCRFTA